MTVFRLDSIQPTDSKTRDNSCDETINLLRVDSFPHKRKTA